MIHGDTRVWYEFSGDFSTRRRKSIHGYKTRPCRGTSRCGRGNRLIGGVSFRDCCAGATQLGLYPALFVHASTSCTKTMCAFARIVSVYMCTLYDNNSCLATFRGCRSLPSGTPPHTCTILSCVYEYRTLVCVCVARWSDDDDDDTCSLRTRRVAFALFFCFDKYYWCIICVCVS